jgi:RNA polymerase-interacting CarD/CdnL/TRCF family regulator
MIMQGDISNAKKIYNAIKKSFESSKFSVIERKMLYNNIRALYNEIELASIEQKS